MTPAKAASSARSANTPSWQLKSPDRSLVVTVHQATLRAPYPKANNLYYMVQRGEKTIIEDSPLGLTLSGADGDLVSDLTFTGKSTAKINETYPLLSGKFSQCTNRANELTLDFQNAHGRAVQIVLRAYNDGMAYRYRLPGSGPVTIAGEASAFRIPPYSRGWVAHYEANYEAFYDERRVGKDMKDGDYSIPAIFDVGSDQFALLAESDVGGHYCSSRIMGSPDRIYRIKFADPSLAGTLPWATAWRVVITGTLGQVVQSTLVENLATPAVPGATGWIHAGRAAWSWWSEGTGDLAMQKRYVDFASAMGWEFNLVDAGWTGWNNRDPAAQVKELVEYARAKHVGILLWSHYHDLDTPEKREKSLPLWRSWGVVGVKVDFFDSDSMAIMQQREAILAATWKNHLITNFHGDQGPRGQNRTWPHFLTREGVHGAEYYKFGAPPTPVHNCTLPYTRNVTGPMDYTPVTFSAGKRTTTAAHELALAVVFQSAQQHLADSVASYERLPVGREFLKQVPAGWDELRFLSGYPAQYTCVARRKGDQWFIGMNNAAMPRPMNVPLSFLGKGRYRLDLYKDGKAAGSIDYAQSEVTAKDSIALKVPANGGFAARLVPVIR